jgi:ABC-2 type transport system permease protein
VSSLTGTLRLIRLALRQDRVLLPVWLVSITGLAAGVVASIDGLYASEAERIQAVRFGAASPIARVFDGAASGTETGAVAMVEAFLLLAILASLMSMQAVVRHTRLEEETGRAELVGSAVVGRRARLLAAMIVALGANAALALLLAGTLVAIGLPLTGSLAAGLAVAGVGTTFAGVAAVTAQVLSGSRGANGAAGAVLGVAFLLRAIGDVLGEVAPSGVEVISAWPSWLSPLGWGQQVRPFHQDNWEVLALLGGAAILLFALAAWLVEHRDLEAGLVAPRGGPARAPASLRSAVGLAWRLQRGVLVAWAVGLAIVGLAFGAVGESAEEVMDISEQFEQAMAAMAPEGGLIELFFAFTVGFLGIAAAAYTVQALLRMRAEETSGRLEAVLATSTSRGRWLGGHVAIATSAARWPCWPSWAARGRSAYGALTGDWSTGVQGMLGAALLQAPAALALGGLVVLAVALRPRWAAAIGWGALAASLVMGQLGALLELPQPVLNLSPFTHVPPVGSGFEILPLVVLGAAAVVLAGVGVWAFGRRDLVTAA